MRTIYPLIFLIVPSLAWSFDFKGITIGAATTPAEVQERLGVHCGEGYDGMQVCNGDVTIARESASINLVINAKGVVQRIDLNLSPDAFDDVAPELIRKFGKPTSTSRSVIQNRMGAKYPQVIFLWTSKDGTQIRYAKYAGTLNRSNINFNTKADRNMLKDKESRKGDI